MKFHTFGDETHEAVLLIHGMLTPWQIWNEAIEYFRKDYFVIVPELDAHTEEEISLFQSVEAEVEKIKKYILNTTNGKVFLVCGLSMGGRIATILAEDENICINNLVLDGAPLGSVPGILKWVMKNNYLSIIRKSKQREPNVIESFKKNFLPEQYLDDYLKIADNMKEESACNIIDSLFSKYEFKKLNSDIKILFMHGTKGNEFVSKKAAIRMKEKNPHTDIKCYKGYAHAYLACYEPQKWIKDVSKWLDIK